MATKFVGDEAEAAATLAWLKKQAAARDKPTPAESAAVEPPQEPTRDTD